jgi:type VI secretion system protein ImpL
LICDELVRITETDAKAAEETLHSHGSVTEELGALRRLHDHLGEIRDQRRGGWLTRTGWSIYGGERAESIADARYTAVLQEAIATPVKSKLEAKLKLVTGDKYLRERALLKTYLMLSDVEHLDVDPDAEDDGKKDGAAVGAITAAWAEILKPSSNMIELELRARCRPHVRHYLERIKSKRIPPVPADETIVADARTALQKVPVAKRYYERFVNALIDEEADERGADVRGNRQYPPITLGGVFADRPDVLRVLSSQRFQKEKHWKEVEGPYTEKGHYRVLRNIREGAALLEREQWVVPLTDDEKGDSVPLNLGHLAEEYDQRYVEQWNDWILDIAVQPPVMVQGVIDLYATLGTPEWPYLRILRTLADHTQWKDRNKAIFENEEIQRELKRRIGERSPVSARDLRLDIDLRKIGERISVVPGTFRKTTDFAFAPPGGISDTPLGKYIAELDAVREALQRDAESRTSATAGLVGYRFTKAALLSDDLLKPLDDKARTLLTPLLTSPLSSQVSSTIR